MTDTVSCANPNEKINTARNMLTLINLDKPLTKTSRGSASQNLARHLSHPGAAPHAD